MRKRRSILKWHLDSLTLLNAIAVLDMTTTTTTTTAAATSTTDNTAFRRSRLTAKDRATEGPSARPFAAHLMGEFA